MASPQKRRDFIKNLSLAGASLAITNSIDAYRSGNNEDEIKNNYFIISFDRKKGKIDINRTNGYPLLINGVTCINSKGGKRHVSPDDYKYSLGSTSFKDQLGTGKKLIVHSKDKERKSDLEIHLSLYDNLQAITIETICKNVSHQDLIIHSVEPIRVIKSEGGILNVPGVSKCITNGEMYYDTGTIHEFGSNKDAVTSGDQKGVKLANGLISSQTETIHSWWNAGLFSGYDKEGIAIGYLENNLCLGNLLISKTGDDEISFLTESVYAPELVLKPGKTIRSNRVMINIDSTPYKALETYAATMGKINNARTNSIVDGWCSWFYTLANVSEKEVLLNAEFASKHLKAIWT